MKSTPSWLRKDSILFRPQVIYNKKIKKYILWLNRLPRREPVVESYKIATFTVGTSNSPDGPFTFTKKAIDSEPNMKYKGNLFFIF